MAGKEPKSELERLFETDLDQWQANRYSLLVVSCGRALKDMQESITCKYQSAIAAIKSMKGITRAIPQGPLMPEAGLLPASPLSNTTNDEEEVNRDGPAKPTNMPYDYAEMVTEEEISDKVKRHVMQLLLSLQHDKLVTVSTFIEDIGHGALVQNLVENPKALENNETASDLDKFLTMVDKAIEQTDQLRQKLEGEEESKILETSGLGVERSDEYFFNQLSLLNHMDHKLFIEDVMRANTDLGVTSQFELWKNIIWHRMKRCMWRMVEQMINHYKVQYKHMPLAPFQRHNAHKSVKKADATKTKKKRKREKKEEEEEESIQNDEDMTIDDK